MARLNIIEISIDRITDYSSYPGWVECSFYDMNNVKHTFTEKIPVVTTLDLTPEDSFPQKSIIPCKVVKKRKDGDGKKIYTATLYPYGIEYNDETVMFDFLESQVSKWKKPPATG